jgi:hypothetical protein
MSKIRSMRQHTDAPRQEEGPSTGAALLAGAVLGLATDAVLFALPRQQARLLSGAHLAAAGGVYLGFAVADGRLLGAGWLAHVTWDALHHRGRGPTRVRSWYPALCIGYDVAPVWWSHSSPPPLLASSIRGRSVSNRAVGYVPVSKPTLFRLCGDERRLGVGKAALPFGQSAW